MQAKLTRQISYVYLTLIPFLAAVPALAIGHISHKIYLSIWIINSLLMLFAMWVVVPALPNSAHLQNVSSTFITFI